MLYMRMNGLLELLDKRDAQVRELETHITWLNHKYVSDKLPQGEEWYLECSAHMRAMEKQIENLENTIIILLECISNLAKQPYSASDKSHEQFIRRYSNTIYDNTTLCSDELRAKIHHFLHI